MWKLQPQAPFLPVSGVARMTTTMNTGSRTINRFFVKRSRLSLEPIPANDPQLAFPDGVLVNDPAVGLTYV